MVVDFPIKTGKEIADSSSVAIDLQDELCEYGAPISTEEERRLAKLVDETCYWPCSDLKQRLQDQANKLECDRQDMENPDCLSPYFPKDVRPCEKCEVKRELLLMAKACEVEET